MCVVSAVHDYGRQHSDDWWSVGRWHEFQDLIKQAEKFDKATGQPHCEDPEKTAFLQKIEQRLKLLEAKVAQALEPEDDHTALYGSSILASTYTLPGGITVQLGQIVARAHKESGLTVSEWNAEDEGDREVRLMRTLVAMRREAEERMQG